MANLQDEEINNILAEYIKKHRELEMLTPDERKKLLKKLKNKRYYKKHKERIKAHNLANYRKSKLEKNAVNI